MEHKFEGRFDRWACVDDKLVTTLPNGIKATARIVFDEGHEPPWESGDGYGIVSDWRRSESKRPGERILVMDTYSARFYDVEETTKKAKEEQWGCGIAGHNHATKGEETACAVEQDYAFHKAWCDNCGYDPYSTRAMRIYEACRDEVYRLCDFLGDSAVMTLRADVERL